MTVSTKSLPTGACGCPQDGITRRTLLRGAAGALAATAALPLLHTQVAFASEPGYAGDVLVVLSLRGGFDGLSAVAPVGDPAYYAARPTLAVPQSVALPLDSMFGLHPALAPLKPLWDAGTPGVVHAVGQPDGSRSHFQATEELERAAPGSSLRTGWLDRVLGARSTGTSLQAVSLRRPATHPGFVGPGRDVSMSSLKDFHLEGYEGLHGRMATALRTINPGNPQVAHTLQALDDAARARTIASTSTYPDGSLGQGLADVARMVKSGVGLQLAALDVGDWDMHEGLGTVDSGRMVRKLTELGAALAAFASDLGSDLNRVTVVTLSEFGRRVAENGSRGTDHGYGNAVLLLGGGVVGGKVHGSWPGLDAAALDRGDLAGTTDYRDVLGEVLRVRCGTGDLSSVFPGLQHQPLGIVRAG